MHLQLHESRLAIRQSNGSSNSCNCMSGGTIAGIVVGTIAGTLLIIWLVYSTRASSNIPSAESTVDRRRRQSSHHGSRRGSHSRYVYKDGRSYVAEPTKVYYKPEWRAGWWSGWEEGAIVECKNITTRYGGDRPLRIGGYYRKPDPWGPIAQPSE